MSTWCRPHLDLNGAGAIVRLLANEMSQAAHFVNGKVYLVNQLHDLHHITDWPAGVCAGFPELFSNCSGRESLTG